MKSVVKKLRCTRVNCGIKIFLYQMLKGAEKGLSHLPQISRAAFRGFFCGCGKQQIEK